MIAPDMATMLVFLFTDAAVAAGAAPGAWSAARTRRDLQLHHRRRRHLDLGHAAVSPPPARPPMAPLADGRRPARRGASRRRSTGVMLDLAHQVVRDGEGATKFVEIRVDRRRHRRRRAQRSACRSPTRRWSRPRSPARTRTGAASSWPSARPASRADRDTLSIRFGDILVAEQRLGVARLPRGRRRRLHEAAGARHRGRPRHRRGAATVWTCDLTHRYIEINADYRS